MHVVVKMVFVRKLISGFFLLLVACFSSASFGQSYPISIRPPVTLNLDGQAISQGIFNLSGVTVFSDPGGVLTSQIILDPTDPSDDVQKNPAIIGSVDTKILLSVPDDSEILIMEGFFDPVIPDLPVARFKVILGAITPNGIPEFVWYLPTLTANDTYTQISSVNGSGLSDNADLFTLLGTNITLINNDPAFPDHNFTPIGNNGLTNNWYVATPDSTSVPGAVAPLPANAVPVQLHGFSGCLGVPPVTSIAWLGGSGNWFSSNWDLGYGPNNGVLSCDYRVQVGSGTVLLDSSATVNTLEIGDGAEVDILNGVSLNVVDGLFGNEGTLRFSSTGSPTSFSINQNTSLAGATGNFVFAPDQASGQQSIELNANSLSSQAGSVHTFTNSGRLRGSGGGVFGNNGTVRATGGQFEISSVDFVNNGTLATLAVGDEIFMNDSVVTGGIVSAADGSKVSINRATFDNVTNLGAVEIPGTNILTVLNTLSNSGTIQVGSNSSSAHVVFDDAVALSGTGSILFEGGNSNIRSAAGFFDNGVVADVLTIAPGASQTLSGQGAIEGGEEFTIINNGGLSIESGPVDLNARLENNGSLVVQNGGQMALSSSGRIVGGTLETQGSGFLAAENGIIESVDVSGSVKVTGTNRLTVKSGLSNNGTIEVGSNSSSAHVVFSDAVALSGTGSILFEGGNSNIRSEAGFFDNGQVADVVTIAVSASQTISGEGAIEGGDEFTIINNGGLSIGAGPVDLNARLENNGSLVVLDGGQMELSSSGRIVGGTLETREAGFLSAQNGTFENVDVSGSVKVTGTNQLTIKEGLSNNGTIEVGSNTSSAHVVFSDAVTLSGAGSFVFSGGNSNIRSETGFFDNGVVADVVTITSGSSQTMSGPGAIEGGEALTIINNGGLSIGAGPVDLNARLENNGSLVVQDGGQMELSSSGRIVGGTLVTQGSGFVSAQNGVFENIDVSGSVKVTGTNQLIIKERLSNNGTIEVGSNTSSAHVVFSDVVALSGTGSIVFAGGNSNIRPETGFFDNGVVEDILTIAAGASQTISGEGEIAGGDSFTIINNGELAIGAGPVELDTQLENNGLLTFENGGVLEVSASGSITGGALTSVGTGILEGRGGIIENVTNSGAVSIPNSQRLSIAGDVTNDGTISVNSTGSATRLVVEDAVTLSGNGNLIFSDNTSNRLSSSDALLGNNSIADTLTIGPDQLVSGVFSSDVPITNNGTISPGASPGIVTLGAAATLTSSSTLLMEIDGVASSERDQIIANGPLVLGGTLTLRIAPEFLATLSAADQFDIVNANAAIDGSFSDILPGERLIGTNGTTFVVEYGAAAVDPTMVMLKEFEAVSEDPNDSVERLSGIAEGGTVTIVVNGVEITIITNPGDTSAEVMAALAAAINEEFPGQARVIDNVLELTGLTIDQFTTTDPGLTLDGRVVLAGVQCDPAVSTRTISELLTWHLLSVPCQTPIGSTMATLIDDPAVSGDPMQWAAFTYNSGTGIYDPLPESAAIPAAGTGFWFISVDEVTLKLPNGSVKAALSNDAPCDTGQACRRQSIEGSVVWNMIGNPLDTNIRYVDILVTNEEVGCTQFTPCNINQPSIESAFFFYDEFRNDYLQYSDSVEHKSVARPWDGFWAILAAGDVDNDWTIYQRPYQSQFMFVTDEEFTASSLSTSGGAGSGDALAYADSLCQTEAQNAGFVGTYRAWLSNSSQSPADVFNQLTTPYIRSDGTVVAGSYAELTDGAISSPISVSATINNLSNSFVWTATATDGGAEAAPNGIQPFCNNWSVTQPGAETFVGDSTATDASWTRAPQTVGCEAISAHLYCTAQ